MSYSVSMIRSRYSYLADYAEAGHVQRCLGSVGDFDQAFEVALRFGEFVTMTPSAWETDEDGETRVTEWAVVARNFEDESE